MNAKVGKEKEGKIAGSYGLGKRNERGEKLIEFCKNNDLCIANTMFKHHPRHLYTWTAPKDDETETKYEYRNQIDDLLVPQSIMNARTFPGAGCNSDHELLVMKMRLKLKKLEKPKKKEKLDIDGLNDCRLLKLEYAIKTENKFAALNDEGEENNTPLDIENSWTNMKEILLTTVEEVLGKKKKTKNTP